MDAERHSRAAEGERPTGTHGGPSRPGRRDGSLRSLGKLVATLGVPVASTVWFVLAHAQFVWRFFSACEDDYDPVGPLGVMFATLLIGWVTFVAYGFCAVLGGFAARRRGSSVFWLVAAALLAGGVLLSWLYGAVAIPAFMVWDPDNYLMLCNGRVPASWPTWIPLPWLPSG